MHYYFSLLLYVSAHVNILNLSLPTMSPWIGTKATQDANPNDGKISNCGHWVQIFLALMPKSKLQISEIY